MSKLSNQTHELYRLRAAIIKDFNKLYILLTGNAKPTSDPVLHQKFRTYLGLPEKITATAQATEAPALLADLANNLVEYSAIGQFGVFESLYKLDFTKSVLDDDFISRFHQEVTLCTEFIANFANKYQDPNNIALSSQDNQAALISELKNLCYYLEKRMSAEDKLFKKGRHLPAKLFMPPPPPPPS